MYIYFSLIILLINYGKCSKDVFTENLYIKPLSSGHIYTFFEFETIVNQDVVSLNWEKHFNLFPSIISKFIVSNQIEELHFSLTKGVWKFRNWDYPYRNEPTGVELFVWLSDSVKNANKVWTQITNQLSGLFCASIDLIDKSNSISPKYSLRPFIKNNNLTKIFYSSMPNEAVCTENLTPWKKLLPCYSKAGLSSLLNSVFILNSHYFSIALDFNPICLDKNCEKKGISFKQSVSVVFNLLNVFEGKQSWSLIKLFGSSIKKPCELAKKSLLKIDISNNQNISNLNPNFEKTITEEKFYSKTKYALYDVNEIFKFKNYTKFNVASLSKKEHVFSLEPVSLIYANFYFYELDLTKGEINCKITNLFDRKLEITYLELIPWYLRVYLHTLKIKTNLNANLNFTSLYYEPAKYKKKATHLEFKVIIPANSIVTISFDVDKLFMEWTEYPPDANHGIYVNSAVITINDENILNNEKQFKIHTEVLLVSLPTPDFSMPYNVICLVSTVISLAFCPIHNLTTRKIEIADLTKKSKSLLSFLSFFKK